ncbi:MAG: hypothetical protein IKX38_06720 [Bacteroidales bacterium]|nr:hypothetical protein [Bacteroidales bacterium]
MKKIVLIAVIALFAFCSCEKIDLIEQVPQLKGSWQWHQTSVGGVVGVIHPETTQSLILVFEDNNKISIGCNGETVVAGETYSCKKSNNSTFGEYLISLPKDVQNKVAKCLGISDGNIVINGYISFGTLYTNDDTIYLTITKAKGKDAGVEGGNDFHCSSVFVPVHTLN